MSGGRIGDGEFAARVNAAVELAAEGSAPAEAARALAERFGVSVRQARRYVDTAAGGWVEIPDRTVVFTVKLPQGLVGRVRAYAAEHRLAISAVVAAALVDFLARELETERSGQGHRSGTTRWETAGMKASGPTARQCYRASSRPYDAGPAMIVQSRLILVLWGAVDGRG